MNFLFRSTFTHFFLLLSLNLTSNPSLNLQKDQASPIPYQLPPGFSENLIFQSDVDGDEELYLLTGEGLRKLTDNNFPDSYPKFSPDGKKILYMAKPGKYWQLFILILATGKIEKSFEKEGNFKHPCWAPDGKSIAFDTDIWGGPEIGSYDLEKKVLTRLTYAAGENILPDWSPDGKTIAFSGHRLDGWRVYILGLATKKIKKLTNSGNCRPDWSPDGKWIAYVSNNGAKYDIFLIMPDGTDHHPFTDDPHTQEYEPRWSRDGKRIYFHKSKEKDSPPFHIWVINADRTQPFQITRGESINFYPDVY